MKNHRFLHRKRKNIKNHYELSFNLIFKILIPKSSEKQVVSNTNIRKIKWGVEVSKNDRNFKILVKEYKNFDLSLIFGLHMPTC